MAWHDATCAALKLEWEDGLPGCLTCHRKAPALSPIHPILPPEPPPDVPRSQLVCTWPPRLFSEDFLAESREVGRDFHSDIDSILKHTYAEGDSARLADKPLSSSADENDRSSLEDSLDDVEDTEHDGYTEDKDAKILALICANIDKWTSRRTPQQPRMPLESTPMDIEQPQDPPGVSTSFHNIYASLPNDDSVRLLRLHGSATESDPVHCTLVVHKLCDPNRPTFEAFSYTWADSQGNSSLCEAIFIGPQYNILPVTKNCLAALRCFRTSLDRLVWVDAICINQFNLDERGHQVSLMRDVYMSAARVLTYLGNCDEGLGDVMKLSHYNDGTSHNFHGSAPVDVSSILRLPYFSRIWVIQEVLLSTSATLSFDTHTMHWQDFRDLARHSPSDQDRKSTSVLVELSNSRKGDMSLWSWLRATEDSRCGDLRDRVYGLMGLITKRDRINLPVDYSISKQQLYTGLAMYWLTSKSKDEKLITTLLDMALLPKTTLLPSWAPDWTPQSNKEVIGKSTPLTPLTLQFDTSSIEGPSLGLRWPRWPRHSDNKIRWTLYENCWGRVSTNSRSWHTLASDAGCEPPAPVHPLSLGGTISINAFHILSVLEGNLELADVNGKPLYGLRLAHSGDSEPVQQEHPGYDTHLYVSLDWQEALVLRKHADAVYSISNRFRMMCGPVSSYPGSIPNIDLSLEDLESQIAGQWLADVFFYGHRASPVLANLMPASTSQKFWSIHFPRESAAGEVLDLPYKEHVGEDCRRSTIAAMTDIWEAARDSVDETKCSWGSEINLNPPGPTYAQRFYRKPDMSGRDDLNSTVWLSQNYTCAAKPQTASPEELCTHLRSVARDNRDSCRNYAPLQQALSDLEDITSRKLSDKPSGYMEKTLWAHLINRGVEVGFSKLTFAPTVDWTIANVMYIARALLKDHKIDPELTLEQNSNLLWIHVLTMEMVARLRGCLQHRLILKALRDKMRKPQKIYLI
jgi:hypothetical protein